MVRQKDSTGMLRYGRDANKIYNGEWDKNKFSGTGELSTPHGYYKGPFNNSQYNGIGFTYLAHGVVRHFCWL